MEFVPGQMTEMMRVEMPKSVSIFDGFSMVHCMEQTIRMVWGKPQKSFLDRGLLCRIVQEDSESHVCF